MSDTKHAEVTIVVHLPYDEHNDEDMFNIRHRADQLKQDAAFRASWYGREPEEFRDSEECYVEVTVNWNP